MRYFNNWTCIENHESISEIYEEEICTTIVKMAPRIRISHVKPGQVLPSVNKNIPQNNVPQKELDATNANKIKSSDTIKIYTGPFERRAPTTAERLVIEKAKSRTTKTDYSQKSLQELLELRTKIINELKQMSTQ